MRNWEPRSLSGRSLSFHRWSCRGLDGEVRLKSSKLRWVERVPEHWKITTQVCCEAGVRTYPFKDCPRILGEL